MKKEDAGNRATGERIRHIRENLLDLSQEKFAEPLGVTRGAVGNWELGKGIKRENLQLIARHYPVPFEWIATGRGPDPQLPDNPFGKGASTKSVTAGAIPHLKIHGGLGSTGLLSVMGDETGTVQPEFIDGQWQFPPAAIAHLPNMKRVYAMRVTGDSMEPTLPGGSFVFVDTGHRNAVPDDIYAINYGDGLMVKRCKLIPQSDKMLIISDNERYGSDELARDSVEIYGRIIAWFQWRG